MKAVVYDEYGPPEVLRVRNLPKPVPRPDEILVEVRAATVAAGDWRMRKADPFAARLYNGLFRPKRVKVLGFELAGRVEAVGKTVTRFRAGDDVFAFTGIGFGAHAEYKCLRDTGKATRHGLIAHMPKNASYAEAAAVPVGGLTALAFVTKARVKPGAKVLIYGASGSVGTYAIQIAKHLGAEVTAVSSSSNLALTRSLGADVAIDYTREDFAAIGPCYDTVFDAVGKVATARARAALKAGGTFVSVKSHAPFARSDLETLRDLFEAGDVKAVIDRRFSMDEIALAHAYVETGRKKGNVVIDIAGDDNAQRSVAAL